MALQLRKVTEIERLRITPVIGEPVYTYDTNKLYVGDGVTVGGVNVIENIEIQDFLNVGLDDEDIIDGSFIYYDDADNEWKIGRPVINTGDLADVTEAEDLEFDFMFVYDAETQKWVIRQPLPKSLSDVDGINTSITTTGHRLLEYNEETDDFESKPLPPRPNIGDLLGISVNGSSQRGHIFVYDDVSNEYLNDYITDGIGPSYNANLHDFENLDYIEYVASTGFFEKKTPFLKDVDLMSVSGIEEGVLQPIVFDIVLASNGKFAIGTSAAPPFTFFFGKIYEFNLSDPGLTGKTFRLALMVDGTHSVDPPGEILESDRITIEGTPGIDGILRLDLNTPLGEGEQWPFEILEDKTAEIYYFCVEDPEAGNKITIEPFRIQPFVVQWDQSNNEFNIKRFDYSLNNLGNVEITPDEEGNIFNQQMLAYDAGNNVWTNPGDRVVGVGIGAQLPRSRTKYANALWNGGIRGLGSFDLNLGEGEELKDLTIKLSELQMEGEEQEFDAYMFDSEEDREEFYDMLETAEAALGPGGILSPEAIEDIAEEFSGRGRKIKRSRLKANQKEYTREGKSTPPTAVRPTVVMDGGGGGGGGLGSFGSMGSFDLGGLGGLGGGGGGGGGGGSGDSDGDGYKDGLGSEPGLDDFGFGFPSPEEEAEAFKTAYKNFPGNLKKVFGAILARNRLLKQLMPESFNKTGGGGSLSDLLGGGVEIEYTVQDAASEGLEPMIFGWRQSTDIYGYYYFTYTQRASALTYNSRNHYLDVQSCMRRCGCIIDRITTFKVCFYYDADDSRYMAGEWLRIVEWQNPTAPYTGELVEYPSLMLRKGLEEWDAGTRYRKGTRVIYNDKVWECLIEFSEASPPAAGTELALSQFQGQPVYMFVEIPAFSVKSQVFEGIYQMRCYIGKDEGGGYTHPAFSFGEKGDEADYIYIAANIETQTSLSGFNPSNSSAYPVLDTRSGWRTRLATKNLDIGVFQYDALVHSALQHLMVQEFQTFNIEKRLGECNLAPATWQDNAEHGHALSNGNRSACSQPGEVYVNRTVPIGIPSYRGIFRPYGNMGYHIDGLNINSATGAASVAFDFSSYSDQNPEPLGYTFLENLPKPVLNAQGYGAAFISNFYTYRRTDFSDFVFMLPKTLGGGQDAFLGDRIVYRNAPNTNTLLVPSVGSPYSGQIFQAAGGNGIFNLNLQPLALGTSAQATRWCIKRRGKSLTPETEKVGEKQLGTVTNSEGTVVASNLTQAEAQEQGLVGGTSGGTWNFEKTVDVLQVVPGNDRLSGEAGTATASLARIVSSRSAICIGICDETTPTLDGKWEDFRERFPDREHWLLVPSESDPVQTKPFPYSRLDYGNFTQEGLSSGDGSTGVIIGIIPPQGDG
ncbi:MAG: hypothetical protein ACO236_00990, partial [Candidatus Nanopelagicaceae bacterium]